MKCGACKDNHGTVAEVRACYTNGKPVALAAAAAAAPAARPFAHGTVEQYENLMREALTVNPALALEKSRAAMVTASDKASAGNNLDQVREYGKIIFAIDNVMTERTPAVAEKVAIPVRGLRPGKPLPKMPDWAVKYGLTKGQRDQGPTIVAMSIDESPRTAPVVKSALAPAPVVDVPAGIYAIEHDGEVKCYTISYGKDGGKWEGFTFMERVSSDDRYPIKNREEKARILAAITVDVEASTILAGHTLRQCRKCRRTLSDTKNPYFGMAMGPKCGAGGRD